ncbi:alpha-(1-_3)-arabinofuranosyltransferase family protein [uncultured Corynebacterium sp.]|uniref:alpha-(1->3)-arabinofuranosyltransferase domain-containing protein n=1 Tax=uncultured Corynebacterium sp. TaxID=159447 RepID=UPI0025990E27|nr:alpha-(1->3)-arabinofuranosyltransferase family protein [uncultured Corynebacterium sp.]
MRGHVLGWVALTLLSFLQPPGRVAADTKFDLTQNPVGFLRQATHAYTEQFTLGQIQNQAYGYLFPQGPFFLLPLPDWVLQRLWWALVLCVAYSGTLLLARRVGISPGLPAVAAAALYALNPRILTTLTAISSEAWPVALVPWTLLPLLSRRPNVAGAVVPIALMGAVNATATILACVPAFVLLAWRREFGALARWCAGTLLVSVWWIGPLLVLGRYSPPFTEFIESAFVTTHWLNPAEILRGTTSWAPFVDAERTAGFLLVAEPVFILATAAVAALGLAGLARRDMPWRGFFVLLLSLGFLVLGTAHFLTPLYDGPLAPFRNLHKLDPLVRLPLVLGVGWALSRARPPAVVAAGLAAAVAVAPAWSLRLLPEGTWTSVSPDWVAAGEWLDEHAAGTRTLVVPPASFARQTWGWTRDEPIQAVTSSPFAVRDAIPLVDPEAIRGLDGQAAALDPEALRSIGVGAVVVRHDLESGPDAPDLGEPTVSFGAVDIHMLEPDRGAMITSAEPVRVDGGGEVLALLYRELGYFPARLGGDNPDIVTDTPALAARNYGTLDSPLSAHLRDESEGADVRNRLKDYPSAGTPVGVAQVGDARASSSAADATSFGGADPSASLTAAFDGLEDTAWWPAPGDDTGWIESSVADGRVHITATRDTTVRVASGGTEREVSLVAGQPRTVSAPGDRVRVTLTERAGIAALDAGATRIVEVPGTADTYFFQRAFPATDLLQRRFTTAAPGEWTLSAPATIDGTAAEVSVHLEAGTHEVVTDAETLLLTRAVPPTGGWVPFGGEVGASTGEQRILTTLAFNEGLRASVDGVELEPELLDAGAQAFRVPPGVSGTFTLTFAGERPYRLSLLLGGAVSLAALVGCVLLARRRSEPFAPGPSATVSPLVAAVAVGLAPGAAAAAAVWAIRRYTLLPSWALASGFTGFMGLWLARAPWPQENYAGGTALVLAAGCGAVAALAFGDE